MRNTSKMAVQVAGASALALLISASAFADSRHQEGTGHDRGGRGTTQSDRGSNRQQGGGQSRGNVQQSNRSNVQQPNRGFQQTNRGVVQQDRSAGRRWDRSSNPQSNRGFQQSNRGFQQSNRGFQQTNRGFQQTNRGVVQQDRSAGRQWDRSSNPQINRGFQANRGNDWRGANSGGATAHNWRENDRVRTQGRIRSFTRERGGFRIFLEGDRFAYFVPEGRFRFGLPRIGLSIGFGGIFRGGFINVDALDYPYGGYYGSGYYNDGYAASGYLSGIVDRVDYRYGTVTLVDDANGRLVTVDMRSSGLGDLHPGDRVELTGSWSRPGVFAALRVDDVRTGY